MAHLKMSNILSITAVSIGVVVGVSDSFYNTVEVDARKLQTMLRADVAQANQLQFIKDLEDLHNDIIEQKEIVGGFLGRNRLFYEKMLREIELDLPGYQATVSSSGKPEKIEYELGCARCNYVIPLTKKWINIRETLQTAQLRQTLREKVSEYGSEIAKFDTSINELKDRPDYQQCNGDQNCKKHLTKISESLAHLKGLVFKKSEMPEQSVPLAERWAEEKELDRNYAVPSAERWAEELDGDYAEAILKRDEYRRELQKENDEEKAKRKTEAQAQRNSKFRSKLKHLGSIRKKLRSIVRKKLKY